METMTFRLNITDKKKHNSQIVNLMIMQDPDP